MSDAAGDHVCSERATVASLGEDRILSLLLDALGPVASEGGAVTLGAGDDAALLEVPSGRAVLTTDTLTEDQDFRRAWFASDSACGTSVGHKAVAQNLSDVVAMGARPTALLLSLVLPPALEIEWIEGFGSGVRRALETDDAAVRVAGGDLGSGPVVTVTVTAVGEAADPPLLRSAARPGDMIAVGPLGRAAAGLALLEAGHPADAAEHRDVLRAQLRPVVDLGAGTRARGAGAAAGMDVSDGLLRDARRLAAASDVVLDLRSSALRPMGRGLLSAARALGATSGEAAEAQALRWMLTGGEDYVLLVTLPAGSEVPEGLTVVGSVQGTDSSPAGAVLLDGEDPAALLGTTGWDSLR
ncbi:thiamine-phosphate kinase [Nesterenkonia marinintestina]|uniref:thiamine-phosphate kinase n=1 Tax=Nesterenkonia marinintestina TaxID=2979865 RepID=UPI0021BEE0B5|nr:thiamine-phosphate kinase [Nesterenkonia sp. GX14115]